MFRKFTLTLAALATLGLAGLVSTEASALKFHPHKHHHHHHRHFGWGGHFGPGYGFYGAGYGPECYIVKKHTPWGIKYRRICY